MTNRMLDVAGLCSLSDNAAPHVQTDTSAGYSAVGGANVVVEIPLKGLDVPALAKERNRRRNFTITTPPTLTTK